MLIKASIFQHYNDYLFNIPLSGGERIFVKNNQNIKVGDSIFSKRDNGIGESHFLVDELGCSVSECIKYIQCINGQYIEKGSVIAQKLGRGGFTVKQVICKSSGIVDMGRLHNGFVDILGEENELVVKSNFSGVVSEVFPGDHIKVKSCASAIDLVSTTFSNTKLYGYVEFLTDDTGVISDIPDKDLKNKIVWAGSYLQMNLALKLFQKGVSAILTYCMEYGDFRNLGLPIAVIEGFGKIHCDKVFFKQLKKIDGRFAVIDGTENQLFVASDIREEQLSTTYFVKQLIGVKVISRHSAHYGYIGTVVQIHDMNYVTVDFGMAGKSIIDIGSLDFISM